MKLDSAQNMLSKMGVQSHADSLIQAGSAMEAATHEVETVLDSPLNRVTVTDYFDFMPSIYDADFSEIVLLCSRGFIDTAEDISLYVSPTTAALPDALLPADLVEPKYYTYNAEQGRFALAYLPPRGRQVVAISYTAGYEDEDTKTPDWLRNTAIAYGIRNFGLHNVGYLKKDIQNKSTEQWRMAYSLASSHIRTRRGQAPSRSKVS